eukprot:XP_017947267.1 PREDICTED: skin secretory protein xP2-like [Xenopus tropicalis]
MNYKLFCVHFLLLILGVYHTRGQDVAGAAAEDCKGNPLKRRDCGHAGVTEEQCKSKGCCYDASIVGVKWCFFPRTARTECSFSPGERQDCGHPGITPSECASSGCCFDASIAGVKWCFHPK